jgi:malonyl-ACP decarboxylase
MLQQKANCQGVVVTGMGIISSLGQGISSFLNALLEGKSHFQRMEGFQSLSFPVIGAKLVNLNFETALQQYSTLPEGLLSAAAKAGRRAPHTIQASLLAALEAWEQAKLFKRSIEPQRIGLVVAGQNTTTRYQQELYHRFQQETEYLPPSYALHFMDTDQVGTLSEVFGIQGEGFTVGGASASGNVGIIQGTRLIQQDLVDVCLVVGVLADLSPLELQGFHNIGALGGRKYSEQPSKACRPFDQDHEGFVWGQASGCLVLESKKLLKEDKIPYLGEILGSAIVLDGNRSSAPSEASERRAMQQAITNANIAPTEVQYINTHGTSSPLGDEIEIKAILNTFNDHVQKIWLNATKSITGHCLWSAGVVEAIATLLQLQEQFVHPNLNLDKPIDSVCRFAGNQLARANVQIALNNSFGFGGINTSIVLKRKDKEAIPRI